MLLINFFIVFPILGGEFVLICIAKEEAVTMGRHIKSNPVIVARKLMISGYRFSSQGLTVWAIKLF